MAKVDELVVEIKGKIGDLEKSLKEAVRQTGDASEKMQTSFEKVARSVTGVQAGFAKFGLAVQGAQTAFAPFVAIMEKVNSVSGLKRTADMVGLNIERFQELSFAARKVGIDSETFADAVKDLNVKITDAANGATAYEEVLNMIGLQSKELIGLSVDEQFRRFADAMSKANDETRRFVADEINDSMFQLNGLLKEGAAGLDKYTSEARKLGVVMSSSEMKEVEELNKSFSELTASADALAGKLIANLSPALKAIVTVANEAAGAVSSIVGDEVQKDSETLADKIAKQKEKIALLNIELKNAETSAFEFEDSLFRAFQPEKAIALQLEIDIAKMKIKAAKEEMEGLVAAQNGLGGLMTGGGSFGGDGSIARLPVEESVANEPKEAGSPIAPSESVVTAELERLDAILHEKEVRELEAQRRALEERQRFNDAINGVDERAQKYNTMLWESGWRGKSEIMSKTMGSMSKLMNSESRKMFEVGKAAAMAQVLIDTPKAAMSAYSAMAGIPVVGPALGAAAAAAAIASGMSQLQNIKSTSFGGGGGGSGGIDAGGGAVGGASAEPQEIVQRTDVAVTLVGDNFGGDGVVNLIDRLNEAVGDGATLRATQLG